MTLEAIPECPETPELRLPQAGGRGLPLRTLPRGSRYRTRAEAPGQPRRRDHRRVRRPARARPPPEQSGPRRLALERKDEAGALGSLLVAAARSRAQGVRGVALVPDERQPAPQMLISSRQARGGSGCRDLAASYLGTPPASITSRDSVRLLPGGRARVPATP